MSGSTNRGKSAIDPPNYTIMMKNETHPKKYWTFLHGSCFNYKYVANVKVLFLIVRTDSSQLLGLKQVKHPFEPNPKP